LYSRALNEFRGTFRVKGDVIDIYPAYADTAIRIQFLEMMLKRFRALILFPEM
jgi:excinuclease UvrABC helicase subunit UvrB